MMAILDFMLADTVQLLKLIVFVSLPIAFFVSVGLFIFFKRPNRG